MKRAFVTVGLGFGDEGKGATVDYLCRKMKADLVVRYCGGSQCGHNVELPGGLRHCFSQFGSGTLAGVPTYVGHNVIIYPEAMRNEAQHLKEIGVSSPWELITVNPSCLVTTPYTRAMNCIRESARGNSKHGSCGHGIGETRSYWLKYGQDSIFAKDLELKSGPTNRDKLRDKLEAMRQRYMLELEGIGEPTTYEQIFDVPVNSLVKSIKESCPLLRIRDMPDYETAIFEGAQGVLLDEWNGFYPYVTWSTVTTHHAKELTSDAEVTVIGCTRPYTTRHGAGPLPNEDSALAKRINDIGNPWNQWQDTFRAAWLNVPLLMYAAQVVGKIDFLAVSCLDHLKNIQPRVSESTFDWWDKLKPTQRRIKNMEKNGKILKSENFKLRNVSQLELMQILNKVAPVGIEGRGPTWENRISILA